jgi:glucose-6-phosphate-specific signal transduction histidine kinase
MSKTVIKVMFQSLLIGFSISFGILFVDITTGEGFNYFLTPHHFFILAVFSVGSVIAGYPLGKRRERNNKAHLELNKSREVAQKLLDKNELILREVHHRIKNNMSIIISLLTLQASTLKNNEAVAALNDACSRVRSMMILYDKLYKSQEYDEIKLSDYLDTVMDEFAHHFNVGGSLDVIREFDDIFLSVKTTRHWE